MRIQVQEYENCSIEISCCEITYVENNVLEVHMIYIKDKQTDSFAKVLISNKPHQFDHV